MKLCNLQFQPEARREHASVLIIVLWVAIGLVSIALYFANSMTYELRASDNRVSGLVADQTIEGAARYVGYVLENYATNGTVPDKTQYECENVPIGDAHFWLIGRDPAPTTGIPTDPYFGLIDEGSKLNLNTVNTNVLSYLPNMTADFAQAILDWRGTNGSVSLDYASQGYLAKNAPFETLDELRLVYGADVDLLAGDDINRNGVLEKNEKDTTGMGQVNSGLFDYVTVYPREPNFRADGTTLTNVNKDLKSAAAFTTFFQDAGVGSASTVAQSVFRSIYPAGTPTPATSVPCTGILDFAMRCEAGGMSSVDFAKIYNLSTTTTNLYFRNRLNLNTASAEVMEALFMGLNVDQQTALSAAQSLVTYRQQNANNLGSIAWIIDALGNNNAVLTALRAGDYVTTRSFQFTADIAAVGPFGRGYRRVKFIFDLSDGSPKILYRQDLSRLGWALGEKARETSLAQNTQ